MKYKVNTGSPVFGAFSAGIAGLVAATAAAPGIWRAVLIGVLLLVFILITANLVVLFRNHRWLSFEKHHLVFSNDTISSEDIKYVITYEHGKSFVINFNRKKMPLSVAFHRDDAAEIQSRLRAWADKNGVELKPGNYGRKRSNA